jgi:CDP-glucose 4,6-dehydratase
MSDRIANNEQARQFTLRSGYAGSLANPSIDFWSRRRVLVLGHTGFKGAWLSLWLRQMGAQVTGLSLPPPTSRNLFVDAGLVGLVDSRFGDIRDQETVRKIMQEVEPQVVVHLAAQALVRASYQDPVGTYATNVMGTVHVLAAAQATDSVQSVIVVTSDKCYENREWVWAYRESDPMGGHDPYSSSKGCAELVTAAWRSSFCGPESVRPLGVASVRAGNVFGGGDWADERLVPDCIRALLAGEPIRIRNPSAVRPWQHVLDPLCGYLILAERLAEDPQHHGEAWNFGPADEDTRDVSFIATRMVEAWGARASWEKTTSTSQLHEATMLKVDISKARSRLPWAQRMRLELGLDWTVDWYRNFSQGRSALALTEEQIDRFCEMNVR